MRRKFILFCTLAFFSTVLNLSAIEGLFQINSVFQRNTYPMFGSGGKDVLRVSSAGIALKSTRGSGIHGVIDLAILFPYRFQEKLYPAKDFSTRSMGSLPVGLDGLVGIGYRFKMEPMSFFLSGGFHTGALLEGGNTLVAFGVGADAQTHVKMGEILTSQIGLKFSMDFAGTQTFTAGSNQFAGFPVGMGFYTGIGLSY